MGSWSAEMLQSTVQWRLPCILQHQHFRGRSGLRTRNSPNQYFSCCWWFSSLTSRLAQRWSLVGTCIASSFRSYWERNEKQLKTRHYSYSTASRSLTDSHMYDHVVYCCCFFSKRGRMETKYKTAGGVAHNKNKTLGEGNLPGKMGGGRSGK